MSIASELTRLQNAKNAISSAITNKGVTVPSTTKLDGMAALIGQIQQGSSLETSVAHDMGSAVGGTIYYIDKNGQGQRRGATDWVDDVVPKGSYYIVDFGYEADGFYLEGCELVHAYGPVVTTVGDPENYVVILKITGDRATAMI